MTKAAADTYTNGGTEFKGIMPKKTSKKRASPTSLIPLQETEATTEALPATLTTWDTTFGIASAYMMNGGGNTYTTNSVSSDHSLPANSYGSRNSTPVSAANSEAFSLREGCSLGTTDESFGRMSTSEASSIMEHHIASHPIETEDDFHYIAEILRSYENEDDLRRVAELIRANKSPLTPKGKSKKKKDKKSKKKKDKEQSKKRISKHKKPKYEPPPLDEDEIRANDTNTYLDDDSSNSDDSSESSSSSSSDSSSATTTSNGGSSSLTSSVRKVKRKHKSKKEKKRKKKEKERKLAQKEAKKKKKAKKKTKKRIEEAESDDNESAIVPPSSIEVVKASQSDQHQTGGTENGSTQQSSANTGRADWQKAISPIPEPPQLDDSTNDDGDSGDGPNETFENEPSQSASNRSASNSSSDADGSLELFMDELDEPDEPDKDSSTSSLTPLGPPAPPPPVAPPVSKGPESFPYPGMIQSSNNLPKLTTSKSMTSIPDVASSSGTDSIQGNDESTSSEDPTFPYPGMLRTPNKEMQESNASLLTTESDLGDSFAHDMNNGVPFPPLPENEALSPSLLQTSGGPANDQRSSKSSYESLRLPGPAGPTRLPPIETSATAKSASDSWQDSWAQMADSSDERETRSNHASTLPTIFSSSKTAPSKIYANNEYQDEMGEPTSDSSSNSTPDDQLVSMALRHFSDELKEESEEIVSMEFEKPRQSSAYPPLGNFQFARQISTDYAKSGIPLPASKLNASLVLNRQTSSDLLKTTLDMSRQRSGQALSSSVLRPPGMQRGNTGVVSTTDMVRGMSSDKLQPSSSALLHKGIVPEPPEEAAQPTIRVRQQSLPDEATGEMIQAEFSVKPRLLCLHGWRSNAEITRLQLDNLGLLDFFDPIFIEGPHISRKPADDAVNLLSQGPYYSWLEKTSELWDTDADGDKLPNRQGSSVKTTRPSIYSFGRKGTGSGKRNNGQTATDELMLSLKAVMMHLLTESQYLDAFNNESDEIKSIPCYDAVYGFSQGATLVTLLSYEFVRNRVLEELNLPPMRRLPWRFVISACAANTNMKDLLAHHFELEYSVQIPLPSVHIIGLSDSRKGQSEAIMKDHYNSQQVFPIYLDSGHGIPTSTRKLSYVLDEIINWFLLKITLPDVDIANVPLEAQSQNVSMLHIIDELDKIQREQLEEPPSSDLDIADLHLGAYGQYIINTIQSSHSNLIEMLEDADSERIAFLAPEATPLTYGNFLKFIRGDGDLRRAGAKEGFTVAYVAPFGIVSATAFITVAAQCAAAPLDPGYNEADYLLALEQLKPDLVITFDGVDSGLVHKVALGQGLRVAHATVEPGTCGLFRFDKDKNEFADMSSIGRHLVNHADNNGLILRTSGTTSKPKVVPLKLWAIVGNSRVIAKNLGLRTSDIALNAMPLFHIGGLSANLLSSLAAGASVILLPKFNAADFFDYLTSPEEPRPTWYSAVPTMHAAIHTFSEDSIFKTSLRFIRSGAAAMPQDLAVKLENTFDCPLILTYSMTEQMPISQPPRGYSIARNKPNSVGQPVCTSMCIVDKNMRPIPFFSEEEGEDGEKLPNNGEVCISGPMVIEGYVANPNANANSFFRMGGMDWFRSGDMGHLDKEGFLFLTGRSKELIKRGGDQVSPYEVEDAIYKHSDVKTVVVFAIPDPIWGERVGAAVVLRDGIRHEEGEFKRELNKLLLHDGLQPFKLPEELVIVKEDDLPKTRSNKYIRIGLAKTLGLNSDKERDQLKRMKPVNYNEAAVGVKFFLAFAVTYVHIGNFDNRELEEYSHEADSHYQWEHTRSWCWHNPIFFLVGGFLLAAGTHVPVTTMKDLGNYYSLRIAGLHPMYLISILFCTANFVARCNPSNYIQDFDRLREPLPGEYFVCQATPIEWSYWPSLIISIVSYACTLQSWPVMIPFSWFLSYYTWFSSVYIFCIFVFPWCHQQYHAVRDDIGKVWKLTLFWLGMNYLYVGGTAVLFAMKDDALKNYFALSSYLFPPGWFPCCACGVGCFYLFRHYRPNERSNAWIWGAITDVISFLLLAGWLFYGLAPAASTPEFAEDDSTVARHWAPFLSRVLAPIGFLWFWGLAVGTGCTSSLFSIHFVVEWLAPASYNMFLFHQPIAEWYYLATRGEWWAYPKSFFWFSPYPYPVAIWEFFIVVAIVVAFSVFMEAYANEFLVTNFAAIISWMGGGGLKRKSKDGETVFQVVQSIIHELTYADVELETGLTEAGLSSMTTIILVSEIKKVYKTLKLTARDVINSETVGELVDVIEGRMKESAARPELALGKRTGVVAAGTWRKMMGESSGSAFSEEPGPDDEGDKSNRKSRSNLPKGTSRRMATSISQNNATAKGSVKSRHSSRSRRASFVLDSSSGSGASRNGAATRRASRRASNRMSFTIQAANTPGANTTHRPSTQSSTSTMSRRYPGFSRPGTGSSTSSQTRRNTGRPQRSTRMIQP